MSRAELYVHIETVGTKPLQTVGLSRVIWKRFGFSEHDTVTLQFGSLQCETKVVPVKDSDSALYLTNDVKEALCIPFSCRLEARLLPDRTLRLGPVYGILVEAFQFENEKVLNIKTGYLENLLITQKKRTGICFIFQIGAIRWESQTVTGAFLVKNDHEGYRWEQGIFPLPDVIHNRLYRWKTESSTEFSKVKAWAEERQICLFNPAFFNKSQIHDCFEKSDIKKFIPNTVVKPALADLKAFLSKYRTVYLKPINGSLGIGICVIQKDSKGRYVIRYRFQKSNKVQTYKTLKTLVQTHFQKNPLSKYVLQRGIALLTYNGSPFDFRIHLNRNLRREWEMTAIAGKVAGEGNITTHERYGGKIVEAEKLLQDAFGSRKQTAIRILSEISIKAADAIASSLQGELGEAGVDAGIDHKGNIWIFEVNSKPGRSIFRLPSISDKYFKSTDYIFDYGKSFTVFRED